VIDFSSFNRLDLWSRYTAEPNLDALIYVEFRGTTHAPAPSNG